MRFFNNFYVTKKISKFNKFNFSMQKNRSFRISTNQSANFLSKDSTDTTCGKNLIELYFTFDAMTFQ